VEKRKNITYYFAVARSLSKVPAGKEHAFTQTSHMILERTVDRYFWFEFYFGLTQLCANCWGFPGTQSVPQLPAFLLKSAGQSSAMKKCKRHKRNNFLYQGVLQGRA